MGNPWDDFSIDETPEWTLDMKEEDLLESYYSFNWEKVQETLAKLRRFRYIQPTDAREVLIKKLLPVVDGFERLFDLAEQSGVRDGNEEIANWLKSFEAVYRRLLKILCQEGLQPIESVGKQVDLDCHEVVDVENHEHIEPGTIVREEQKGYLLENRVLRDAKVIVAKPKTEGVSQNSNGETVHQEGD